MYVRTYVRIFEIKKPEQVILYLFLVCEETYLSHKKFPKTHQSTPEPKSYFKKQAASFLWMCFISLYALCTYKCVRGRQHVSITSTTTRNSPLLSFYTNIKQGLTNKINIPFDRKNATKINSFSWTTRRNDTRTIHYSQRNMSKERY